MPVYDSRVQLDERVRYTWDDDTRDEVLARLRSLHRQRAAAEAANAPPPDATKGARRKGAATGGLTRVRLPLGTPSRTKGARRPRRGRARRARAMVGVENASKGAIAALLTDTFAPY